MKYTEFLSEKRSRAVVWGVHMKKTRQINKGCIREKGVTES